MLARPSAWARLTAALPAPPREPWLPALLARNGHVDYLRRHGSPQDAAAFRDRLPLVSYADLAPWLEDIQRGRADVLFAGRPVAYERTSGSAGPAKLIPYSAAGLNDFRRALLPWLVAGAKAYGVTGRVYLSISPATRPREQLCGVPVGLDDGAYLGPAAGAILAERSAVPFEVAALTDIDAWRAATLAHLVAAHDLELISCWSPTFLLRLLEDVDDPVAAWPRLKIVSCWASAASRPPAAQLAARLPQARLQPKGLLSTECAVTVPDADGRPVLTPHGFFEFLSGGRALLATELTEGDVYEVVATTASGLYRYRTGDLVRCEGFAGERPVLEFLGRDALTSDLVGEKLTEPFVAECLEEVPGFRMLVPAADGGGYMLVVERGACASAEPVERLLCTNPQYAYARRLGQLRALRLCETDRPYDRYVDAQLKSGVRLGDIKPLALRAEPVWHATFGGAA